MNDRILVGVDGSPGSLHALRWAVNQARKTDATIDAVIVWESPYATGEGLYTPMEEKRFADAARKRLAEAVERVTHDQSSGDVHLIVLRGDPAQILCSWSAEAELLVLGTRGIGGFAGLLLGSVSAKCAQHSRCPVVIVPKDRPADRVSGS